MFYTIGVNNKRGAKGNKYPLVATVCMMINWFMDNRTGFAGIPDNFEIPTDLLAIQNFVVTFARNEFRPLQALFVSKKGFEQGLAMYYFIKAALFG